MTLDLATIPTDLLEASPNREQASEPADDSSCEPPPEPAPLPAETASTAPPAALSPLPEEASTLGQQPSAIYPGNHFLHALYGGFMNMPDLPGVGVRADLWDSLVDAYTSPDPLFVLPRFPSA